MHTNGELLMTTDNRGDLRRALQRADVPDHSALEALGIGQSASLLDPGKMVPVTRMPILKVDIKLEVAAFIDRYFTGRTVTDGTILSLSKENLVEQMSQLFHSIEQRAGETGERFSQHASSKARRSTVESVSPSE